MTSKLLKLIIMTSFVVFVYVFLCAMQFFFVPLIEMGISCSCDKSARYKNAIISRAEPYFASVKSKVGMNKTRHQDEMNSHEKKEGDFKKAVKDSVDIDPSEKEEEDEPVIPQVKEVKVLPPIRNRTNTMAHISYTPKRVWGGSVSSYLGKSAKAYCPGGKLAYGRYGDAGRGIDLFRLGSLFSHYRPRDIL